MSLISKKNIPIVLVVSLYLVLGVFEAHAQEQTPENIATKALAKAVSKYDSYFGKNLSIYSGKEYIDRYTHVGGHPFFLDDYWEQGSVTYEGQFYDSIYLKYDIYLDQVVVEYFSERGLAMPITPLVEKISGFTLQGHTFKKIIADSSASIQSGFYDVLYSGTHIEVFSRRKKEIVRTTGSNTLKDDFVQKDRYFIQHDGVYYPVKNKGAIARIMEDHKREVKHFLRTNNLYFRADRDRDITIVAKYYDSLFIK